MWRIGLPRNSSQAAGSRATLPVQFIPGSTPRLAVSRPSSGTPPLCPALWRYRRGGHWKPDPGPAFDIPTLRAACGFSGRPLFRFAALPKPSRRPPAAHPPTFPRIRPNAEFSSTHPPGRPRSARENSTRRSSQQGHPKMKKRILFLCSRNKLRSPTAEAVFADNPALEPVVGKGTTPPARGSIAKPHPERSSGPPRRTSGHRQSPSSDTKRNPLPATSSPTSSVSR
jgi:hypothetical protein